MAWRHTHMGNRHAVSCDQAHTVDGAVVVRSEWSGFWVFICYDIMSFAITLCHLPFWTIILESIKCVLHSAAVLLQLLISLPLRLYVLYHLPNLCFLDSSPVSAEESKEAKRVGQFMRVVKPSNSHVCGLRVWGCEGVRVGWVCACACVRVRAS